MTGVSDRNVVIIGGGISGLSIAEALSEASETPVRVRVLEADKTPGGKIQSFTSEGFVVETGPHGFLDKEPAMFALIDRLGLSKDLLSANEAAAKRYLVRGGRIRKLPEKPPEFLMSDILPLSGKLRILWEPWAKARPDHEESVWHFAARRIGPQAANVLVDAMVTGIYGGDPKQLSLPSAFPRMFELETEYKSLIKAQIAIAKEKKKQLPAGEAAPKSQAGAPTGTLHSFRHGLGQLTRTLAERTEVLVDTKVERLETVDGRWRVHAAGGPIDADAVVLTVPAFEVARLVGGMADGPATQVDAIPYADIAVVVHGFAASELEGPLDGFGFLIPHQEKRRVLGSIWASSVFPDHAPDDMVMFRTMVGGWRNAGLLAGDDASVIDMAREELAAYSKVPRSAQPVIESVLRWPRGIPQYTLGHAARVAAADAIEAAQPGLFIGGNAFRGVAMLACVADAPKVAARILRHMA